MILQIGQLHKELLLLNPEKAHLKNKQKLKVMSSGEATEPQSEDSISRYTLPFGQRWQNQLQLGQIY